MSTFSSLHYHITFSTKLRVRTIDPTWQEDLHQYIGGIIKVQGGFPECIGGVEDHVHLLLGLKPTHRISDVMREIKKSSSKWVHETIGLPAFQWQEGFAVFTVSPTARTAVQEYIKNQRQHHHRKTFREELVQLLEKAGIQYDPKYLQ